MIVTSEKEARVSELRAAVEFGLSQDSIYAFERAAWREGASYDETSEAIAEGAAGFARSFTIVPPPEPRDTLVTPPPSDEEIDP